MKKKLLAVLLVICMAMTLMPTVALAVDSTEAGATYTKTIEGTEYSVIAAPLCEATTPGATDGKADADSYKVSIGEALDEGMVPVKIVAANLLKHTSTVAGQSAGHYVGVGIKQETGTTPTFKMGWNADSLADQSKPDGTVEVGEDADKVTYNTFYFNLDNVPKDGQAIGYVSVTASEKTTTYKIDMTEVTLATAPKLSGLTVTGATLKETFDADTSEYTADVASTVESVTIAPTATDADITVTGATDTEKTGTYTAALTEGNNVIKVTVAHKADADLKTEYTITITKEAAPTKTEIKDEHITGITAKTYTGSAITQEIVVKVGDDTLVKDTDYEVNYADNINVGTAKVTITGIGDYTGTVEKTFTINKATLTTEGTVTATKTYGEEDSAAVIEGLTLKGVGGEALVEGTDYDVSVSFDANENAGEYSNLVVTVTLKGDAAKNYEAVTGVTATGTIEKADWAGVTTGAVTVGPSGADGYVLPEAIKVLDGLSVEVTVEDNGEIITANGSDKATYDGTNKKLAFTMASDLATKEGETATITAAITTTNYNEFSFVLTVTGTNKTVPVLTVGAITKPYDGTAVALEGETIETWTAKKSEDSSDIAGEWSFVDSSKEIKNVSDSGTYTVKYTPSDTENYATQTAEVVINITAKTITEEMVTAATDDVVYDGTAKTPSVTVSDGGNALTLDTDYTVAYTNNINVGTATITVTGKGNYSGTVSSKTFEITKAAVQPIADADKTVSLNVGDTKVINIKTDGTVSATSSDAEKVTAVVGGSGSDKTVTITGVAAGTATVTISAEAGTNYNALADTEVAVTVRTASTPSTGGGTYVPPTQDKTETTTSPDGTTTTTTTKPDGSKEVAVKAPDGTTADVKVDASGKTQAEVSVSAEAANKGSVTLPIPAVPVASSSAAASTVKVSVPAASQGKAMAVTVPTQTAPTGTVAIIVKADGTEQIVKKSVVTEDGLYVPIDGDAEIKIVNNTKSFTDTSGHWASEAISFVSGRELYQGMGDGTFAPGGDMNRAMLVTVLHRLEDMPKGGGVSFDDVASGQYYADAVAWGAVSGIVQGNGSGFDPNGTVTRQQLATFLYRYAKTVGADTTASGSMSGFNDAGKVQSWASDAMSWAIGAGLINGKGAGVLDPEGNTTRAEVATILMRFCQFMAK